MAKTSRPGASAAVPPAAPKLFCVQLTGPGPTRYAICEVLFDFDPTEGTPNFPAAALDSFLRANPVLAAQVPPSIAKALGQSGRPQSGKFINVIVDSTGTELNQE